MQRAFLRFLTLVAGVNLLPLLAHAALAERYSEDEPTLSGKRDFFRYFLHYPLPEYPYEARRTRTTGAGIALVRIDQATGNVARVVMYISTRSPILDRVTIDTLSRWQFRPDTPFKAIRIPITFTLEGSSIGERPERTQSRMIESLSRYLGKGTVISAPITDYPLGKAWDFKEGRGVYEVRVDRSGAVVGSKILKKSGDQIFDCLALNSLARWKFSHGPLVIEIPLRFVLTPGSYSVSLAR